MATKQLAISEQIVEDVADFLRGNKIVKKERISVLTERTANYSEVLRVAANEDGIGIMVLPIIAHAEHPNIPGPFFDRVKVVVNCFENIQQNKCPFSAGYLAEEIVLKEIHQRIPSSNPSICLAADNPTLIPVPDNSLVIKGVNFMTSYGLQPRT